MKLFNLPNILTLCNLSCGILACILAISGTFPNVIFFLILCSLFFDFFDGFSARLTKQSSPIGGELDSLADMISFGLLPGLLIFNMLNGNLLIDFIKNYFSSSSYTDITYLNTDNNTQISNKSNLYFLALFSLSSFFIPMFSALRLAKFNLDLEQKKYFKGLNTPTNTILIVSLYCLYYSYDVYFIANPIFLGLIIIISCGLLISDIPMMSLKLNKFTWKTNELIFSYLIICLILFIIFHLYSIPFLVLIYVISSIIFKNKIVD